MSLSFEAMVAFRHLRSRRRNTLVSTITAVSILGIALGVGTLIVVTSVMSGYTGSMLDMILSTTSHILIEGNGAGIGEYKGIIRRVMKNPHAVAASPYVLGQALLKTKGGTVGIAVKGVDPGREANVTGTVGEMAQGRFGDLEGKAVFVGKDLADEKGLKVGDAVTLISPSQVASPFGMIPVMSRFTVAGLFETGMYDYDTGVVLINLRSAQSFFDMGNLVTGVAVKVDDVRKAPQIARDLQGALGYSFWVRDWKSMNRNLFAALRIQKFTLFVILLLIVLVAAFNIVGTLIMVVMEKGREIAILIAMGASRKSIGRIFRMEGLLIGTAGTLLGIAAGTGLCWALARYKFIDLPRSVYYLSTLPVRVRLVEVLIIGGCAMVISYLSTVYPAWRASRLHPAEILRYE
ncbi:lipoprotein-releasing system transmembrane protein LolE [bacterium BMS3Abin14]|nr:lipoprotein-releasing system transmembrane protein LolE [bacterium BMS3Abin14]